MEVLENTTLSRYEAYKDSGVDWVGEIPHGWKVERLGSILTDISVKNNPHLPLLSITREKGVIIRNLEDEEENHNFIPDDLSNYKVLAKGQFGMNKMKAWQGSYGIASITGIVSPAYFVFKIKDGIDPRYFHTSIRSKLYIDFFGNASDGVRIGQWDLSKPRMKEIPFIIPPLSEQTRIANFLDKKTAQIDQAIALKERLIELLKERRQVMIHKAVTRGLNPDVKMKDSGVDWIGEIPEHWEVKKLKYILNERNERSKTGAESLLMMSQVYGLVVRSEYHNKGEVAQTNVGNKIVYKNDLVFNKLKAHLGVFYKSNIKEPGLVSPDYAVFYSKAFIYDLKYLELLFRMPAYIEQFIIRATGIVEGLIRLYTSELFDMKVPVPPVEEQENILREIELRNSSISKAISSQAEQIEKLRELRASLIHEVVTGKVRV